MKIRLVLAFFLVFILAITALGCDKVKGSGVFYDPDTPQNRIEFKVNLVAGKSHGIWTDVMGSIHLDDEAAGVKVRGGPWMRFYPDANDLMVWDVHVNGKHHKYLDFWYCDYYDPPFFVIVIVDDNGESAYEWWGWEHEVEGDIIIKD